jgi:hypothetical protein
MPAMIPGLAEAEPMPTAESTAKVAAARIVFMLDMVISFSRWNGTCRPWSAT